MRRDATKAAPGSLSKRPGTQPIVACLLSLALLIATLLFPLACSEAPSISAEPPKAAIIDQLYSLQPNEAFISEVAGELEDYGFEVALYQGDEVTVNLYGQLPSYGYKLIIFRAHSGLLGSKEEIIERTCLFTNEPYSQTEHVAEQLSDQLAMARIDEHHPWVFGIGDKFVIQSMTVQFDNTVIVMMGCSCLYLDDLAQAFIDKGASAYLAWDATVALDYVDEATPYLLRQLCLEKVSIKKAVTSTMNVVGLDPQYKAVLGYFPPSSGGKTLEELIK
ncbi:MAG: hypothetical protein JW732_01420 [Dehalococcoidia bacterium]|nr:hypothetical protein [Dehalococcoidia bacterium]